MISILGIVLVPGLPVEPVLAHTIETDGNVGVLFHIEPHHNPKAGEPSQAWFALTKKGGDSISIDQCNCQLTVYSEQQVVAQPALQGIAIEQYTKVPAATIVFPKAGVYQLKLQGKPKDGDAFNAFRVSYEVVVQPGTQTASPTPPAPSPQATPTATASGTAQSPITPSDTGSMNTGVILGISIVALMAGLGIGWMLRKRQK